MLSGGAACSHGVGELPCSLISLAASVAWDEDGAAQMTCSGPQRGGCVGRGEQHGGNGSG